MSRLRERERKVDWRRKIAVAIVKTARVLGYGIAVERFSKEAPKNMLSNVKDPELRHRLYQAAFKGMTKTIKEIAEKHGVPVAEVDPSYTSQICPICGSRPMTRSAGRVLVCPRCGFSHDRDVIACMNLLKRLVNDRPVPLGGMPMSPRPEVAVLPMRAWAEVNPLEATPKTT